MVQQEIQQSQLKQTNKSRRKATKKRRNVSGQSKFEKMDQARWSFFYPTFAYIYFPCLPSIFVFYAVRILTVCPCYKVGRAITSTKKQDKGLSGKTMLLSQFLSDFNPTKNIIFRVTWCTRRVVFFVFEDPPAHQKHNSLFFMA